ncbi:hypothetical protein MGYG_06985 [Nannizzia gypsea CBS 118893]|uniref:Zn(2)-C6 fungal-type domain-containing protein n=1 Tax=Arthroderma gypseum (strain ATCC MYA-4604 / CBS 118893) TaxID=535722 RepID=E4V1R7_ARTGP|nr:hypothetical protein MGYG_06985 [Nannizzia gypsea CBS 118893]EFR03982.1 hypothetical protein MGYG_06985 [Nannizzia gypsea CBS 118893]
MPQPHPIYPKLHASSRLPGPLSIPGGMVAIPNYGPIPRPLNMSQRYQVLRTKRKHVLKACDRCRVKKTKCDGNQPCYRCAVYNHPCLFRERKATQTKTYSRGFVEMLESHHALVVKALQQLYTHCINNKCFPGEPIELVDGYPLTHAILDRLGLIKQAQEQNITHNVEAELIAASKYWKTESSGPNSSEHGNSPIEPCCQLGRSRPGGSCSILTPSEHDLVKCEPSPTSGVRETFRVFGREEAYWPVNGESALTHATPDYNRAAPLGSSNINSVPGNYSPTHPNHQSSPLACNSLPSPVSVSNTTIVPSTCPQTDPRIGYPTVTTVQYPGYPHPYSEVEQQTAWNSPQGWSE